MDTVSKDQTGKVIVVYGDKFCYVNPDEPTRLMRTVIEEQGTGGLPESSPPTAWTCWPMNRSETGSRKNSPPESLCGE